MRHISARDLVVVGLTNVLTVRVFDLKEFIFFGFGMFTL